MSPLKHLAVAFRYPLTPPSSANSLVLFLLSPGGTSIQSFATGEYLRVILYAANHEGYQPLRHSGALSFRARSI